MLERSEGGGKVSDGGGKCGEVGRLFKDSTNLN